MKPSHAVMIGWVKNITDDIARGIRYTDIVYNKFDKNPAKPLKKSKNALLG